MSAIKTIIRELTKPKSFKKGESFEEYVKNNLFPEESYKLLHQTHNYSNNSDRYIEETLQPDFKFLDLKTKKEFWVECKYRSEIYDKIFWAKTAQIKRYNNFAKEIPFFLCLGLGGKATNPDIISIIPLEKCQYEGIFQSIIDKFQILQEPVKSKDIFK